MEEMHMSTTHGEMHGEHKQWLSDNSMWRDDLESWMKETDRALVGLKEVERALRDHVKDLQSHQVSITAEEETLLGHERALAEFEAGGPGDDLVRLARPHREAADDHARQRRAHESLKKSHHTAMAHLALLIKALTQPARPTGGTPAGTGRQVAT
jgi:hypothetical protein